MNKKQNTQGFTLVELAIVMTIVGLIIGGILKGQELVFNARAQSTIEEIQSYQAATQTFLDKYAQMPGDMANATRKLTNCDPAFSCEDGNGDSIVGDSVNTTKGPKWIQSRLFSVDQTGGNDGVSQRHETTQFWKHLVLSDIISGVDPTSDPDNPIWGETHPISAMGIGGYHILTQPLPTQVWGGNGGFNSINARAQGLIIRLQAPVKGPYLSGPGTGAISDHRAGYIDRKMDDGDTTQGHVWAFKNDMRSIWSVSQCKGQTNKWGFTCESIGNDCALFFKIQ